MRKVIMSYILNDENNYPKVTVFLYGDPNTNIFYRGVAIFNYDDEEFNYRFAFNKAKGRAKKAFLNKESYELINREEQINFFDDCNCDNIVYKSEANVLLTPYELELIKDF